MECPPYEILIVDDDPDDIELTRDMLLRGRVPVRIQSASNGEEALAFLRREDRGAGARLPDLVLLDIRMPVMDGREFLRVVRADPRLMSLSVVLFTTSNAAQEIVDTYGLGANAYVGKPFGLDESRSLNGIVEDFWIRSPKFRRGG